MIGWISTHFASDAKRKSDTTQPPSSLQSNTLSSSFLSSQISQSPARHLQGTKGTPPFSCSRRKICRSQDLWHKAWKQLISSRCSRKERVSWEEGADRSWWSCLVARMAFGTYPKLWVHTQANTCLNLYKSLHFSWKSRLSNSFCSPSTKLSFWMKFGMTQWQKGTGSSTMASWENIDYRFTKQPTNNNALYS